MDVFFDFLSILPHEFFLSQAYKFHFITNLENTEILRDDDKA